MLLFSTGIANACLCDGEDTVKEAFAGASVIFMGQYLGSEYRKGIKNEMVDLHMSTQGLPGDYEILVYRFKANRRWKGDMGNEVILVTDHARLPNGSEVISDCASDSRLARSTLYTHTVLKTSSLLMPVLEQGERPGLPRTLRSLMGWHYRQSVRNSAHKPPL
jgi:hypothetical protein